MSLFESEQQVQAANSTALAWVKENLADLAGNAPPEVTVGRVMAAVS